jgi:hypothetical protein
MDYDSDVFVTQFPIVKRLGYYLLYSRLLRQVYAKHRIKSEFWTIDAGQKMVRNGRLENPRRTKMKTPHHCLLRNKFDRLKMDLDA